MAKKLIPILGRPYVEGDTQFSLCVRCKHEFGGRAGCAEFARGITEHRHPYPGGNGIRFEETDQ